MNVWDLRLKPGKITELSLPDGWNVARHYFTWNPVVNHGDTLGKEAQAVRA